MWQYALKIALSAIILTAIAELTKRSSFWAAALASLPITSLLAFIWIYIDSGKVERIVLLSQNIFWLVLPSLILFLALPFLLRIGLNFWWSLMLACVLTATVYFGMIKLLAFFKICDFK